MSEPVREGELIRAALHLKSWFTAPEKENYERAQADALKALDALEADRDRLEAGHRESERQLLAWQERCADAEAERDRLAGEVDRIAKNAEKMVADGCTSPSPEAFAYLAELRHRHVAQINALERKLAALSDSKEEE